MCGGFTHCSLRLKHGLGRVQDPQSVRMLTLSDHQRVLNDLYLTRVMDYFDPFAAPSALDALAAGCVKFLVMSFDTDWRFSTEHSRRIVRHLEGVRVPTSFREIQSPWGHDSFLLDIATYHDTMRAFMERAAGELVTDG